MEHVYMVWICHSKYGIEMPTVYIQSRRDWVLSGDTENTPGSIDVQSCLKMVFIGLWHIKSHTGIGHLSQIQPH
jgi:hypothetical protein